MICYRAAFEAFTLSGRFALAAPSFDGFFSDKNTPPNAHDAWTGSSPHHLVESSATDVVRTAKFRNREGFSHLSTS